MWPCNSATSITSIEKRSLLNILDAELKHDQLYLGFYTHPSPVTCFLGWIKTEREGKRGDDGGRGLIKTEGRKSRSTQKNLTFWKALITKLPTRWGVSLCFLLVQICRFVFGKDAFSQIEQHPPVVELPELPTPLITSTGKSSGLRKLFRYAHLLSLLPVITAF